jgi:hypothetical protein
VLQADASAHKLKIKCRAVVMPPPEADVARYKSRPGASCIRQWPTGISASPMGAANYSGGARTRLRAIDALDAAPTCHRLDDTLRAGSRDALGGKLRPFPWLIELCAGFLDERTAPVVRPLAGRSAQRPLIATGQTDSFAVALAESPTPLKPCKTYETDLCQSRVP